MTFRIVTFVGTQTLGDFLTSVLNTASIARHHPGAEVALVYRADRFYKSLLARSCPGRPLIVELPGDDMKRIFPMELLNGATSADPLFRDFVDAGFNRPDLVLTHQMTNNREHSGLAQAVLRFPEAEAGPVRERLIDFGLDPDPGRWLVCLHLRGEGFRGDRRSVRNVDHQTYLPAIRHVIEAGGQVVRLGDPSMPEFPGIEGLVDLAVHPDTFAEQMYALSKARFFLGSDSGPAALAGAFRVPCAVTNCLGYGVWNRGDVMLTKRLRLADGSTIEGWHLVVQLPAAAGSGVFEDNPPEELLAVARHMVETTRDCPGWRPPMPEDPVEQGKPFRMPQEIRTDHGVLWWNDGAVR